MFLGKKASPGIAIGKALVLDKTPVTVVKKAATSADAEISKLDAAIAKSKTELEKIKAKTLQTLGAEKAQIFESHIMLLEDCEVLDQTHQAIKDQNVCAEFAFKEVMNNYVAIFQNMEDEYMRGRATDIIDISERVLRNILGVKNVDLAALEEEVVLVAQDFTPSETAIMDRTKVLGLVTAIGGSTSHSAIIARSLEIPAVVGLGDNFAQITNGTSLIFNGDTGEVILNPTPAQVEEYKEKKIRFEKNRQELKALIGKESVTPDGHHVELAANIGSPKDVEGVLANDGEGVGLFRTEFLFMNRETAPTEEEQFQVYKTVLEKMAPRPVVIRTMDAGGDKHIPYINAKEEENPFLGYRAIRICLRQKEIFIPQIRAILRASAYGKLRVMVPMISCLEEVLEVKKLFKEVEADLAKNNIPFSKNYELGIMIEIPAAAVMSDVLAQHLDFFSIGTNDLIQYTCAVDRMNQEIASLYTPLNPGVLRLINMVIQNAHRHGKWVGMCGEAASMKELVPVLLGMGLDEFSMSASSILPVRKIIRSTDMKTAKGIAEKVLTLSCAEEVGAFLKA